jgi:hypothetical protein
MRILIPALKAWSKQSVYAALAVHQAIISFVVPDDIATPSMVSAGNKTRGCLSSVVLSARAARTLRVRPNLPNCKHSRYSTNHPQLNHCLLVWLFCTRPPFDPLVRLARAGILGVGGPCM